MPSRLVRYRLRRACASGALLMLLLLLAACASRSTGPPTSEEALQREAELLVRASLTERLLADTVAFYRDAVTSMLIEEGATREQAAAEVDAALEPLKTTEHQRLLDLLVPIYRRYYTAEEVNQLLSFYQTEVARKSFRVSPQIAAESQQFVGLWSEHFGAALMETVDVEE